ncbi:MAG: ATP-binding protein [Pseudonocardiaceae bacterium]
MSQGHTTEQIATAMIDQLGDRPRQAWRHAHGWGQDHVAHLYNHQLDDEHAAMTGSRISAYERWPHKGGLKPTIYTLAVLARIYGARVSDLVDTDDRHKMDARDRIALGVVDSVIIPHQLPATIGHFVGRTHELNILTAQLDQTATTAHTVIITAIDGTAGIGKTTLALHWARTYRHRFTDGQLYLDLRGFDPSGTPMTLHEALRSMLDAFEVPPTKIPVSVDSQLGLYRSLTNDKRLLIVLDNARDADQVLPLLPGGSRCMVLITSRQQLGALIALTHAIHLTVQILTTTQARELLTGFLGTQRIRAEPESIEELIHHCARLPLALTLAAARILSNLHLPLSTLVDQLRQHHHPLNTLSTGGSRKTDLRAVFSWSYTALTPHAARLFRLLSVHPGPEITTQAAASLAGLPEQDTGELITELTGAHLLEQPHPTRYHFHDLLRAYATEQANKQESQPHQQAALHRILDYYLHTAFAANRQLSPHRDPISLQAPQPGIVCSQITSYEQAMTWFTTEHTVLLNIIDYAAAQGYDKHVWQLPWTLVTFLYRQGHWHDRVTTQQIALTAAARLGDCAAQALTHQALGHAYTQLGRYPDALIHLQRSLVLYRDLGDLSGQARVHLAVSLTYERQDQYEQALHHAHHALDLYHATCNDDGQARSLNALGWYQARRGRYQQALTHCQQALTLYRELNDHVGIAETLDSLGYVQHHLGQHTQATANYQQSLALWHQANDYYNQADTLTHLGDTYHATGDLIAAHQTWQQALTIFQQLAHPNTDTIQAKLATLNINPDTDTNDRL